MSFDGDHLLRLGRERPELVMMAPNFSIPRATASRRGAHRQKQVFRKARLVGECAAF